MYKKHLSLIAHLIAICLTWAVGYTQAQDATYSGNKKDLHVYLLIGQSNMAGRAALPESSDNVIPRCYLLNRKNQWEPATNPLNRYSSIGKGLGVQKLGPGYSFALEMLKQNQDISIGLVVNARGGSKIEQWAKGKQFYKAALRKAQEAQKKGTLKGILWHQGEGNHKNPDGYIDKLKMLVNDLRNDLKAPELPFIAGQVNNSPKINMQIQQLPQEVSNTGYVSSQELKAFDRWHFDQKSMLLLGKRYAQEMSKLLKKK